MSLVRQIVCLPQDTSVLLSVCSGRGIFRSADGGASWKNVLTDVGILGENLAFKGGCDQIYFGSFLRGPVWRSDDFGATWKQLTGRLTDVILCALELSNDCNLLFAGSGQGTIARSLDSGLTWSTVFSKTSNDFTMDPEVPKIVNAKGDSTLYAARWLSRVAIIRTNDYGQTWDTISAPSRRVWALEVASLDSQRVIWAGVFNEQLRSKGNTVFESRNEGQTWKPLLYAELDKVWMLKFDSISSTLWAATDKGLFKLRVN